MTTLATLYEEGRLIRGRWSDTDEQGREMLCLYTALAGDATARPGTCPADLCPRWLAYLIPWIDDAGTPSAWDGHVRRVVAIAPRLGEIRGERSERLRSRCLAVILREALPCAGASAEVVRDALSLCERHGRGEDVSAEDWRAAAGAAEAAAAWATAAVAEAEAEAAAWAAEAEAAAWAAAAAEAAAWAAAWAAAPARAADAAAAAAEAAAAAGAEASDRVISAILDEIEAELGVSA